MLQSLHSTKTANGFHHRQREYLSDAQFHASQTDAGMAGFCRPSHQREQLLGRDKARTLGNCVSACLHNQAEEKSPARSNRNATMRFGEIRWIM
jgi:hypothetical protein